VAFVDVFPQAPRPENLPKGTLFREKPRYSIPGAIWVPNVGYGKIADETAMYFKEGLAKITNDDPTMPILRLSARRSAPLRVIGLDGS